MPNFIQTLAEQTGSQMMGGIMGLALGGINDRRQYNQQERLQALQMQGQKQMTDYQFQKQLEMWKATNYSAQVEQMKQAGINPALLYGMTGGGATTTGGGAPNVQGANAPTGGREVQDIMGLQMQRELLKAQKENIEADTANKKADIPVKGAQVPNIEANTALTKIHTKIAEIESQIKGATIEEAIQIVTAQMATMQQEVMQAEVKTEIDRATKNTVIDKMKAELTATLLINEMTKAQTETERNKPGYIQQQIASMKQDLMNVTLARMQKWREIEIQGYMVDNLAREIQNKINNEDVPASMRLPIDMIEKVIQGIILKNIIAPGAQAPIRGFHNR